VRRRAALGALLLPLLAGVAACKPEKAKPKKEVDPNAPPEPWPARDDFSRELKVITISAWVEKEFGPYYVKMDATDHDTGQHVNTNEHPEDDPRGQRIDGGHQFQFTLAYPTHHNVELTIAVTASKPGSLKGYIATRDGRRYARSSSFGGTAKSVLNVYTQR